jgi:hypothetical protein
MGTTYKCGSTGSDPAGLDTITEVNALSLVAGDIVLFNKGDTFNDAKLTINWVGTSTAYITFGSYGTGANPILAEGISLYNGTSDYINIQDLTVYSTATKEAIALRGNNYINILRCEIDGRNEGYNGINGYEWNDYLQNITIKDCTFHDCGTMNVDQQNGVGFLAGVRNLLIDNCTFYNCSEMGVQLPNSQPTDNPSYNLEVKNCTIYNDSMPTARGGGINTGWYNYDVYIHNNYVYNCYAWGIAVDSYTPGPIYIYNNIIYNCKVYGIEGQSNTRFPGYDGSCNNVKIYNNTIVSEPDAPFYGISFDNNSTEGYGGSGNEVKNNIIVSSHTYWPFINYESGMGVTSDYNYFYCEEINATRGEFLWNGNTYSANPATVAQAFTNYKAASGLDTHSICEDVTTATLLLNSDYHLQSGSPCKYAGTPLAEVTDDYEGTPRGKRTSIGAYQWYSCKI